MKTLKDYKYNGESALSSLLLKSEYRSIEQAIASLTIFTDPETVEQTKNKGLFRIRRYKAGERRGEIIENERIVTCDNDSPTRTFLWANGLSRSTYSEIQFNHIYQNSSDPDLYTSLANICVTPAFLSKLTDKNEKVKNLLKYRIRELYNFRPEGHPEPSQPDNYSHLIWAPFPPAIGNLKDCVNEKLETNARSRIALSVHEFGWLYSQ